MAEQKKDARRGGAAGARTTVPRTGQNACWNRRGEVVDCTDTGQDGAHKKGVDWSRPRFKSNGDGTVTDTLTELTWLKDANVFGEVTWDEALANARKLEHGRFGLTDHSEEGDWRLPNVNEMESLLDLSNSRGSVINHEGQFDNLRVANYWTSTSVAAFPALAWYVALAVGPPVFDLKVNLMRMLPVRGTSPLVARTGQKKCYSTWGVPIDDPKDTGQDGEHQAGVPWPDPRFTDNKDGTVTDNLTGLVWLKNATPFGTQNWEQALDRCNSLADGMYDLSDGSRTGDWRLPNIHELGSLEDYGEHTPALPNRGKDFKNVRQSLCWSSTTVTSSPNLARFLFVGIGSCVWDHKGVVMGVWPVRDAR